jgi:hypothetical protein
MTAKAARMLRLMDTRIFRREVRPYLAHVRTGGRYRTREYAIGDDAMEVSVLEAEARRRPAPRRFVPSCGPRP